MNLSAAIMLVDKTVRPVRVEYDPDNKYNNNPMKWFKTIDPDVGLNDLVIVQTNTRHGFTIAKVVEIDFAVDFNSAEPWGWIGQKFQKSVFDGVLKIEDGVRDRVAKAQENKMRAELVDAMGLGTVDFSDLDVRRLAGTAPAAPQAAAPVPKPSADDEEMF